MGSQPKIIKFADIIEGTKRDDLAYHIRLDFLFGVLTCTRDIVVSSWNTLHELHAIIQACGGWMNYHLYNFSFVHEGNLVIAEPKWQIDELGGSREDMCTLGSERIVLSDAFRDFPSMLYQYDYGDGWEINVLLLDTLYGAELPPKMPCCLSGKGDWPPEDVGGEGGFMRLMNILKDPDDEEYEYLREWAEDQGFEKYSRAKCDRNLSRWEDYLQSSD